MSEGVNEGKKREEVEVVVVDNVGVERAMWGGKLEFFLTCLGAGIGLGNVWRFPYLLYKSGGGAFLIPFLLMLFLIGIPIFMLEISLGQFSSLSPIKVFRISPILKGVGYSMIVTEWVISLYYCVILSWTFYYFFCSFNTHLPWQACNNPWNTIYCTETSQFINITQSNQSWVMREGVNISRGELKTCSEEFFYRKVLQMSDGVEQGGQVVWQLALCLFLAWTVVFLVLSKGITSLGKVVYFTSTFPYLLLTILLVKGVMLEGAVEGIEFYMVPDWNRLTDLTVWSDAATQVFYSLSSCTGALIAMSSYNHFGNNTVKDSFLIPICNVLTSIYAGFVIFSVLGYMATMKGVEVADVAADGPGLVFVVYPEALSLMPVSPLWNLLFFFMLMILGFSSMFSMSESFFTSLSDEFPAFFRSSPNRNYLLRALGMFLNFLISLPMVTNGGFYWFSLVDFYIGGFPLLFLAVFELSVISYIYGGKRFVEDVVMMVGEHRFLLNLFRAAWMLVTPVFVLLIIVTTSVTYSPTTLFNKSYVYPGWADVIGWLIVAFVLVSIPGYFLYYIGGDLAMLVRKGTRPQKDWGPFADKNKTGRYKPSSSAQIACDNQGFDTYIDRF